MSDLKKSIIDLSQDEVFCDHIAKLAAINNGADKKQFIYTFGCQMNVHESQQLQGILLQCGYEPCDAQEDADIIFINTCCIREHAESKVLGLLGTLRELKNKKPSLVIGISGCMTQQEAFARRIKGKFHHVDIILGTNCARQLPKALYTALTQQETKLRRSLLLDDKDGGPICENTPVLRGDDVCSWLTVMYGCNNFCTYCIVPYVRGRERSRSPEAILAEAKKLADNGTKEITLLGQNVNSYGKELGVSFAELIHKVAEIDGLERIRFMTSHPKDISDELIAAFGECKKLSPHLHLPLQAGSDRVLSAMNRHYDMARYTDIVTKLRAVRPDIEISTDLIVGFPGETDEEFEMTLDAVRQMRYSFAFSFAYSPRNGTKAAEMPDQIPESVKKERLNRLISLQNDISAEISREYVGKTVEILSEGFVGESEDDVGHGSHRQMGRTGTNKKVYFSCEQDTKGKILNARITNSVSVTLGGEIIL